MTKKVSSKCEKCIERHNYFSEVYENISESDKNWILSYWSNGKGVIPYELIKNYNDLNSSPTNDNDFFDINDFYRCLRNKIISQGYESVKEFYKKLSIRNISDVNDIYNFQDTIIYVKFLNLVRK